VRTQLAAALAWGEAHADFDRAVKDFPAALRGRRVHGLPHSAWEILEHLRIAQHDILDFSRNPKYRAKNWPDDYWPASPEPPDGQAWDRSVAAFRRDRRALQKMAADPALTLTKKIPHGDGQTYAREILLVLDHNAYHVGELVQLRRLLGCWGESR
jgi:DinB superfamily